MTDRWAAWVLERRAVHLVWPLFTWAIAVQLDPVLVGIFEVDRLAHPVVARTAEPDTGVDDLLDGLRQRLAIGIPDGDVVKPGRAGRRRRVSG